MFRKPKKDKLTDKLAEADHKKIGAAGLGALLSVVGLMLAKKRKATKAATAQAAKAKKAAKTTAKKATKNPRKK